MVLSFILIQNRQGKTRLAKWYAPYTDEEKVKLKGEVRYCQRDGRFDSILTIHLGAPAYCSSRSKISVQLCRVSISTYFWQLQLSRTCSSKSLKHKDSLQTIRRLVLLCLRRCKWQRAGISGSDTFLCRSTRPVLRKCLWARSSIQFLQGRDSSHLVILLFANWNRFMQFSTKSSLPAKLKKRVNRLCWHDWNIWTNWSEILSTPNGSSRMKS